MIVDQPPPIPVAEAFRLPSVNRCVTDGRLTFTLREGDWTSVTVRVNGKRVKQVKRPGLVRVRGLPAERFDLTVTARRRDGRTAKAERRYQPCIDTKPKVDAPSGAAPTTLQTRDIARGSGRRARSGSRVTVHYVLVTWSDDEEKDSSWSRHEPFTFEIGSGQVIGGFERGITGMKIGGRREVIVPPDLGYGAEGSPPVIDPNETLMFVIDLVSVSG